MNPVILKNVIAKLYREHREWFEHHFHDFSCFKEHLEIRFFDDSIKRKPAVSFDGYLCFEILFKFKVVTWEHFHALLKIITAICIDFWICFRTRFDVCQGGKLFQLLTSLCLLSGWLRTIRWVYLLQGYEVIHP